MAGLFICLVVQGMVVLGESFDDEISNGEADFYEASVTLFVCLFLSFDHPLFSLFQGSQTEAWGDFVEYDGIPDDVPVRKTRERKQQRVRTLLLDVLFSGFLCCFC